MAEEAARAVLDRVEAEEQVLPDRARGEHDAAQQRDVDHALAHLIVAQRVHRQVEQREEDELLHAVVGEKGVGREGGGEDRPDGEGQERPVERQVLQPGGAAHETRQVRGGRERQEDLGGEDRYQAGRRHRGHQATLDALEIQRSVLSPRSWLLRGA